MELYLHAVRALVAVSVIGQLSSVSCIHSRLVMRSVRQMGLFLLALVLLPALVYVASRVNSLSQNEALIEEIYDQQLETMLFSVNQHAWDVANSWAGRLGGLLAEGGGEAGAARTFLEATSTVAAVFVADTLLRRVRWVARDTTARIVPAERVGPTEKVLERLKQGQRVGYRKLEPVVLAGDGTGPTVALVFLAGTPGAARVVGLVLDPPTFVTDVLAPKLQDVARGRFSLGVFAAGADDPVYATEDLRLEDARRQRTLWLFDDYVLGIRLSGASIEEVVRGRFLRDLAVIGMLAVVLLAGAWLVYRNVRREVELARIKSDFVSNVSHELRTPLSLIRMYAETLEMGRVTSEAQQQRYYEVISQETHRLTRLINNILNFSHIESGRKTYRLAATDLNDVVRDVLARYALTLEKQGFGLSVHLDAGLPGVLADEEAVTEALINLIDNAVKYSREEKAVAVTTGCDGAEAFVEVADHGLGISPADQARIFDAFYRASDHLVHDTKGTGLGLALVRHIMEAHGGAVAVESQPGQGSRFRLYFNPAPKAAPSDAPVPQATIS